MRRAGAAIRRQVSSLRRTLSRTIGLVPGVRAFLGERISAQRAEAEIRTALERRDAHFLQVVRTGVFEAPRSPYRALFRWAGCEFGDLEAGVHRDGLDRTLERLAAAGVYFTADEFKGKKPVVRGVHATRVAPDDFLPQGSRSAFDIVSSGTMNRPVRSYITFAWLAQRALSMAVAFAAHDLHDRAHAIFDGILPAGGGVNNVLIYGRIGVPVARWFARHEASDVWLKRRYYVLMTRAIVAACNRYGPGVSGPDFTKISELQTIVRWIESTLQSGRRCCLATAASNAARIARAAAGMGVSLAGTKFIATGEPLTDAKRDVIERVGATALSRYAYGGGVNIGLGCADPLETDDVHVNEYLLALIAHPEPVSQTGAPIHPLLCTTLHPSAPRLLINVESGDYGVLVRRQCGCALGRAGLTLHVHHIRSYEKFTSEGMNYYQWDLYHLLEHVLPSAFGGGPGDYQFVEVEDPDGQTRLDLRVAPSVGPVDEPRLLDLVHKELGRGSGGHRFMGGVWKRAGTIRVRREPPYSSPRGKTLPLHIPH
ncbi:MAG: hypothetical protein QN178_14455 [Armatimonadota bacterium]|nr:hypothetical protein [Armatimonadota bacterium]